MATLKKTPCKYGAKCYRKNADHLKNFSHPLLKTKDEEEPPAKKGRIDDFLKKVDDVDPEPGESGSASASSDPTELKITASPDSTSEVEEELPASVSDKDELPSSPATAPDLIKQKYSMSMPQDFFDLWNVCETINPAAPRDALLDTLHVQLVGPYDVLAGRHRRAARRSRSIFFLHWRYYYDPPEFSTLLRSTVTPGLHWGYFRDDPEDMPVFVASNDASNDGVIKQCGPNVFALLTELAAKQLKADCGNRKQVQSLCSKLEQAATAAGHTLDLVTAQMKARDKKSVCKTLHKAGLVVPYDEKTELGYRPVPETPADLRKMLARVVAAHEGGSEAERLRSFEPLEELITLCQFANDECDYGEGLELGLGLFSFSGSAPCLRGPMLALLPIAYQLLHRQLYADIVTAHLHKRSRSLQPDMLK